ncbi:MAG TPA: helix-turn-helix transcriptional regulator [Microvirga sp.]|jgi:transcriptional regulator with XRE-family HTH domain|nr:helix-turn-helix transcriptional regulator [Microvirga sp.]
MNCDGMKIKQLRENRGMTQEVLAEAAGVDRRTIQRAEEGKRLQLETLAAIASVLQVSVNDISNERRGELEPQYDPDDKNAVVLRRTKSGRVLLDALATSFSGSVDCDIDPTADTVDVLVSLLSEVESLMPNPWDEERFHDQPMPLSERIKRSVGMTNQLLELDQKGVGVYVGTYTARAQRPYYDLDEGHLYVSRKQPFEPVTVCRVRLSHTATDKIVVVVDDVWETKPAEYEDDIPF